jgi:antitoxin (DNA-binding transcriptional repressor) of toxin-antitoxin stability system
MRSVGLKILKNKLSEYVRLAAAGETVLITGPRSRRGGNRTAPIGPQPSSGRYAAARGGDKCVKDKMNAAQATSADSKK